MTVGVDPWSMSTKREGLGLACRLVALGIASGGWEIWEHGVHVPREANITGVVLVGCELWPGCGGGGGREGQGRAGQGLAWHGMAWHGRGRKDRLWS